MDSLRSEYGPQSVRPIDLDGDESSIDASPLDSGLPEEIGGVGSSKRYRLRSEIARGGMGVIFKVRDRELRRSLAMKVLLGGEPGSREPGAPVSREYLGRFLEEAQVTAQLDHPGVVPVHEVGIDGSGRVYFTMSLVRGKTLGEIFDLARKGEEDWSMTRALQVILRVCETMAFAHDKGVIHRDIKPANIMVGQFGETYVMDWGLAKVLGHEDSHDLRLQEPGLADQSMIETARTDSSSGHDSPIMTMDGAVVGTPAYMPPEQAKGLTEEIDARADVYAIGALLYQLLAGQPPYIPKGARLSPAQVLVAVMRAPPEPIESIDGSSSEEIRAICNKAMARDAGERYATAQELAADVQRFISGHVVLAHSTGAFQELRKWIMRNKAVSGTAAVALIAVAGLSAGFMHSLAAERDLVREERDNVRTERDRANDLSAAKTVALQSARALALASASSAAERDDPMESLLLAREAVLLDQRWETVSRLHEAVLASRERAKLIGQKSEGRAYRVAFSPDGTLIVGPGPAKQALIQRIDGEVVARLRGHDLAVREAKFLPDGKRVVTVSNDATARIWDLSGREIAVLEGHGGQIRHVAVSPRGDRILTVAADKTPLLWDLSGKLIKKIGFHGVEMVSGRFSRDGAQIVTSARDGVARTLNADDGKVTGIFWVVKGPLHGAVFAPDAKHIVTAGDDGIARMFNVKTKRIVQRLGGHGDAVLAIAYAPNGRRLVTTGGYGDGSVRLWNTSGSLVSVLGRSATAQLSAEYSPDGSLIVVGADDGSARVWSAEGREVAMLRGHEWGSSVTATFSPDGSLIATASTDGSIRLWDTERCEIAVLRGHDAEFIHARYTPDGTGIVTTSVEDPAPRVWGADGSPVATLGANALIQFTGIPMAGSAAPRRRAERGLARLRARTGHASRFEISPDGDRIVSIDVADVTTARIWTRAGEVVSELKGHTGPINRVVFSPDNRYVVTASTDNTARLWSVDGRLATTFSGHTGGITDVAFFPGGQHIVTTSSDNTATVWDKAGSMISMLRGHEGTVRWVSVSPEGTHLLTGSADRTVRLWKADGAPVAILGGEGAKGMRAAFSPDGSRVLSTENDPEGARLWNLSGELITTLDGHDGAVWSAAFSPDGDVVVTTSTDRTARFWTHEGAAVGLLRGHDALVNGVHYSPNEEQIATTSEDGTVRIHDAHGRVTAVIPASDRGSTLGVGFSPDGRHFLTQCEDGTARVFVARSEDLLALAEARITREFTDAERELYADLLSSADADE